jgi:hypothetical protein
LHHIFPDHPLFPLSDGSWEAVRFFTWLIGTDTWRDLSRG